MKRIYYILGIISCTFLACGGGKKQTLEAEKKPDEKGATIEIPSQLVADTVRPKADIKYQEIRRVDAANPPINLDLDKVQERKAIDMADYYSSVKYVMIDFPHKSEFPCFLGDALYSIRRENMAWSGSGLNSEALLAKGSIIAGDQYLGYYQYDENGKYVSDVIKPASFPTFNETQNKIEIERDESSEYITGNAQTYGDVFTFSQVKDKRSYINYYSISQKGIYYLSAMWFGVPTPINENEVMVHHYNPADTKQMPIILSHTIKNEMLCQFKNYNPLFEKGINGAYTNPESADMFYFEGKLNFRQAYNDTVYCFKSSHELNPRYVLNYRKNKPSIETALLGDKTGKYFIYTIKETKDFLYILHTSNYDCPNNRNNGSVKFFHMIYEKKNKKLYQIADNVFPEDLIVKNSIQDGIPVNLYKLKTFDKKMYMSYTKSQLKKMIDSKEFAKHDQGQQEKIKSLYENLAEGGLLVSIFE